MADMKLHRTNQTVVFFMTAVLIFGAARALTGSAVEYDPAPLVWMWFGIDCLMTILCAIFLFSELPKAAPGPRRSLTMLAAGLGLVAGAIKVGIRLSSEHGWWTGHLS